MEIAAFAVVRKRERKPGKYPMLSLQDNSNYLVGYPVQAFTHMLSLEVKSGISGSANYNIFQILLYLLFRDCDYEGYPKHIEGRLYCPRRSRQLCSVNPNPTLIPSAQFVVSLPLSSSPQPLLDLYVRSIARFEDEDSRHGCNRIAEILSL